MSPESKRYALYKNRVEAAWKGLHTDVEHWQNSLPEGTAIKHHVVQFATFCKRAHYCLMEAYKDGGWQSKESLLMFRSLVIGVLTSQWTPLRQVAHQRLKGNPYEKDLAEFDKRTADYYHRVRQALPEEVRKHVSLSPPLVYLGRLAKLTFFSRNGPAVLSVPFGAPYDVRSALAIPHEVGHAVFEQLTGFLPELKHQVWNFLAGTQLNRQQAALYAMIIDWLDDIVADMIGTVLAGPKFAESALWVTVSPESTVGITDERHPVPLLRPYVHLETLERLIEEKPDYGQAHATEIKAFEDEFSMVVGARLKRRFESAPALTVVSLKTVRDAMVKVMEPVRSSKLDVLGNMSLGEVLVACANGELEGTDEALPEWGKISNEECQQFVLKLPASLRPEHATPTASRLEICCRLGLQFCC